MENSSQQEQTQFEALLLRKADPLGISVLLILAWISTSDGIFDEKEKNNFMKIAASGNNSECVAFVIGLATRADLPSLQLACEIIKAHFTGTRSALFMEIAIGIALADRFLLPAENHILRFLADLLGIPPENLDRLFSKLTGKPLPQIPDLSSQHYWQQKQQARGAEQRTRSKRTTPGGRHSGPTPTPGTDPHSILGIAPGASQKEIKAAYRRLAKVHHPDRFHSLGEEAVAAAHITFTRIQEAYSHLNHCA